MVDLVQTGANVLAAANAGVGRGTAGEAITAGDALYKDALDGNKLKLALQGGTVVQAEAVGIALHDAALNQPIAFAASGDVNIGATLVVGETYVVGLAAGAIAPVADVGVGEFPTVLGIATSTSNLKVDIAVGGVAHA